MLFDQVSDSLVNENNRSTLAANAILEECVFLVFLTACLYHIKWVIIGQLTEAPQRIQVFQGGVGSKSETDTAMDQSCGATVSAGRSFIIL